ncbi:MAG: aminotransferase class III-fold pyridoxal phosphate-dependent enzyme, partial [Chloroflexi bacterium]
MDQHATDLLTHAAQTEEEAELDADARAWVDLRAGVPSVWSRYTDLVVERGEGSWIETIHGDRYLDYTSGIGVTSTGHAHPRVSAAIAEQAARIIHAQQNILY